MNDIIKIGSRYNNQKRSYLLVNTVQAKHIPTCPDSALNLFSELGLKIHREYPDARLTVGFAETATAIAAQVSAEIGGTYINTTREDFIAESDCICFREEHSHAMNQKLYVKNITEYLNGEIVLIDDEISTGRTLFNIIQAMRNTVPELSNRRFVVGSIINRLTPEREQLFNEQNIFFVSLYKVSWTDDMLIRDFSGISAPSECGLIPENTPLFTKIHIPESRVFTDIGKYMYECREIADIISEKIDFSDCVNVLFLGTEECMYPSIISAKIIEERTGIQAFCHSTTRSPVYISTEKDYPMQNGYKIISLYDSDRVNYIYNLRRYDAVVVISDSKNPDSKALCTLDGIFGSFNINKRFYFMGE